MEFVLISIGFNKEKTQELNIKSLIELLIIIKKEFLKLLPKPSICNSYISYRSKNIISISHL